jgi:hypothetical protein
MQIDSISKYWSNQYKTKSNHWVHPDDEELFLSENHSFNLDYPVSPFIGNILEAQIFILGANAGYDSKITAIEFKTENDIESYVSRVRQPSSANWRVVAPYYEKVNYGSLIYEGKAALVNACAYRSPKISKEPENKKLVKKLNSVAFTKSWLLDCLLPMAEAGEKLIVVKRNGLWNLPKSFRDKENIVFDPAPISPRITSNAWERVQKWKYR